LASECVRLLNFSEVSWLTGSPAHGRVVAEPRSLSCWLILARAVSNAARAAGIADGSTLSFCGELA
jgi:hypothetical protein